MMAFPLPGPVVKLADLYLMQKQSAVVKDGPPQGRQTWALRVNDSIHSFDLPITRWSISPGAMLAARRSFDPPARCEASPTQSRQDWDLSIGTRDRRDLRANA
jgi:hypothetical protein